MKEITKWIWAWVKWKWVQRILEILVKWVKFNSIFIKIKKSYWIKIRIDNYNYNDLLKTHLFIIVKMSVFGQVYDGVAGIFTTESKIKDLIF